MSLYAIGDLHLSFTANKPMDIFGKEWKDHVKKIEKNWNKMQWFSQGITPGGEI